MENIIKTNDNERLNNQNINIEDQNSINDENRNYENIQQLPNIQPPQQNENNPLKLKKEKKNKKGLIPKPNKILKLKDTNDHRPALQHKVERIRPVYAIPPSKKRSVSQGKPFNIITKYYDESFILEDDEEEVSKNEETLNNQFPKNISNNE